jgi:hypothetical protein
MGPGSREGRARDDNFFAGKNQTSTAMPVPKTPKIVRW